ncbi:glycine--tRNA ligase subunit beta [Marinospirillum alkaliphilum]|uniref:Glycine--tRNA ligase beta subunit n=1 Tax=Marinospirillum alkaliphilum DSM 21637 TaxID=1122209 RepID=A0A1K1WR48_9GAMM|nr:glycine--tRNA ligase subunit beta [Marinospirillum alkaliphilum]SFX39735.1 glycyl-tRNA synthetase beta chain [Marinospirillum alkaliphilum DSM 21637]
MAADLLIELGCEELPPTLLKPLSEALIQSIEKGLQEAGLPYQAARVFATPRRLAVLIDQLAEQQPDQDIERRGPALTAAYKDGQPTKAAQGFAASCGVSVTDLQTLETDKGSWLVYRTTQQGQATATLLPELVNKAFAALPVPKRMRWGASRIEFSRPVHWLVLLHGQQIVSAEIMGLKAGRTTFGHRFHAPSAIELQQPADYLNALKQARVLADFNERREIIRQQVLAEAEKRRGTAVIDEALLDEVTGLVEWPVALTGSFEERFLEVPDACLISSMKANQKYFHLVNDEGRLLPLFITICNIESQDPSAVILGNERVIRPRLSDAAFFFQTDKKTRLSSRSSGLDKVVFQQQLGTLADKTRRVTALAVAIASRINADTSHAERAAQLSKCDLSTEMVLEFPELQGIMGEAYALHDGENPEVCRALREQYLPRHAGDELPQTQAGICLALADRLDTLTGIFGIGQKPTGVKDPFALRRATLGVLNILVHRQLDLDLKELIQLALDQHSRLPKADEVASELLDYMLDRFRAWYQAEGIATGVFLAVRSRGVTHPHDFNRRVQAVASFSKLPEAASLAAANKRVSNLLGKLDAPVAADINKALLTEPAEVTLAEQLAVKDIDVAPLYARGDYQAALNCLAGLREPVDAFFDQVLVMADDPAIRNNRLALLAALQALFLHTADIAQLQQ